MTHRLLDDSAVAAYRRDGIVFPIRVVDAAEAARMLGRLEDIEAAHGGKLPARLNQKPHLLFPWLNELIRHPRIVDAVEDLLGPDLLCWSSQFFAKNGGDPSYVSWHQDATYWGLSSPDVVTAWVAFTPSTVESGCMRVVPGTQHAPGAAQGHLRRDQPALARPGDRGRRRRERRGRRDPRAGRDVAAPRADLPRLRAEPGRTTAASASPSATSRRSVYQTSGVRESATLVRGVDAHSHFDHELPPEADMHPDAVKRHAAIVDHQLKVLYAGAAQPGKLGARSCRPEMSVAADVAAAFTSPTRRHHETALVRPSLVAALAAAPAAAQDVITHPPRALALDHRAGAPGGRVLRQERRPAHQQQGADPGLPERAARHRQGGQRDDPPGGERDEHHRPRLPLRLRARHRRAQRPLPDQGPERLHQAARLRLVQGRGEEARGRRLQAGDGQRLLRPAPPDRRQAGDASPRTWPA